MKVRSRRSRAINLNIVVNILATGGRALLMTLVAVPPAIYAGLAVPSARAQTPLEAPTPPPASAPSSEERISEIRVEGNRAVQADAVRGLMASKPGLPLNPLDIRNDIRAIYQSGFFQDVRIDRVLENGRLVLVVRVLEKPSIREIRFVGFDVVSASSLNDKLQVKRYTIVDDRKINADLRTIEQAYVEKGYYLARASYALEPLPSGEVNLVYTVIENSPLSVSKVNILGNAYFGDGELKNGMFTREKRWTSWLNNAGTFKDEFVNRDKEYLSYIYRDNGFAEALVGAPQARLDSNRQNVEVSYYVEEGERFNIGDIKITGDLLFPEAEILEKLVMKKGAIFRISQFQNDLRVLSDLYGDEGYAFVDVLPKTVANRETRIIDLEFRITKGDKVYFRNIVIEGNSKTRDNVIRRNIRVSEGDRFHATRLERSKQLVERLGYFQEVTIQREPDRANKAMDLRVKVKEKSTGTLSASLGASPKSSGRDFNLFAQGQYSEANLLGKGWSTSLSANLTPEGSYGFSASATEPSIDDGPWSLTGYGSYVYEVDQPYEFEPDVFTNIRKVGLILGREIVEDLRFSVGYSYESVSRNRVSQYLAPFTKVGDTERVSETLTYDKTDNYLQPTSGYYLSASNYNAFKILGGQNYFGLVEGAAAYYLPVTFGEDFRTNFRFAFEPAFVYQVSGRPVPYWERLTLGTFLNMRAYADEERQISPKIQVQQAPGSEVRTIAKGGERRLYSAIEYFIPVIPEANLRLVTFGEAGTVLDYGQDFRWEDVKYDVGFGFRWQTPIAPFRFEWAWPVENGRLGDSKFVFFVGTDSASSLNR